MSKNIVTVDGNGACANVAYEFTEVAAIYPITPSSPMAAKTDEWSANGRLNLCAIPLSAIAACGAGKEDCEGLIDRLRDIDTVEAACVLRESDGCVRVSMRSKRYCDVAAIAKRFGGGGHVAAAGCTLYLPLDEATAAMRDALIEALQ